MRYVSDLSAREFWTYVKTGMWLGVALAMVYAVILAISIFGVTGQQVQDKHGERNLYFALAGKDVADQRAKETAAYIRLMYGEGIRNFKAYESSIDFESSAPNSLKFASNHRDRVEDIVKNPEKAEWYVATYAVAPSWRNRENLFLFFSLSGGWFLFALCVSIGYVWYAVENPIPPHGLWWKYPWRRRYAYPWLPLTIPYVIFVQPGVLLLFIARRTLGADRRAEARQEAEERVAHQIQEEKEAAARRAFEDLVAQAQNNLPESRRNWIAITRDALPLKKADAETKSGELRAELAELGKLIQEKQRNLAFSNALGKKLEEAILGRSEKSLVEIEQEFDAVWKKNGVRAFRVCSDRLEIFTETVFITVEGKVFEIGNFHVTVETSGKGSITVRNLRNTSKGRNGHPFGAGGDGGFCFGANASKVQDALTRRDFLPLITFILEALRSSNGLNADTLKKWRLVTKEGYNL